MAILRVPQDYRFIRDALAAAKPGDTIDIANDYVGTGDFVRVNNLTIDGFESAIAGARFIASGVAKLTLAGHADIGLAGAAVPGVNYSLIGNAGNNRLGGYAGNDTLVGNGGNDTLDGAAGADILDGGDGDDVAFLEYYSDGADTVVGGAGNDLVHALGANDRLDGGSGSADVVSYRDSGAGFVTVNLTTGKAENGSSNGIDTLSNFEYVIGTNGHDSLIGNSAANRLEGLDSSDTLDGKAGADTMIGGRNDDIYVVDNIGDVVTELADEGNDIVQSTISFTLPANVERLVLTGTGNINATGNALANLLTGNAGNNKLDGKAGADTMTGGAGNDTYYVDNAGDVVTEAAAAGTDTVQSTIGYTLGDNVERLTLAGGSNIRGTGNALANILVGNSGNNRLDGLAGKDTLTGGAGIDTFAFTAALGAGNVDTIADFVSGTDRIELAKTVFSALPRGTLSTAAFVQAAAAATAQQHILYDAATGVLSYDADGNAAGGAVAFARLTPGQALKADDFRVV